MLRLVLRVGIVACVCMTEAGLRAMVVMVMGVIGECAEERWILFCFAVLFFRSDIVGFISLRDNASAFVAYHCLRANFQRLSAYGLTLRRLLHSQARAKEVLPDFLATSRTNQTQS